MQLSKRQRTRKKMHIASFQINCLQTGWFNMNVLHGGPCSQLDALVASKIEPDVG